MSTIRERLCAEFSITPEEYGTANIDASDAVRFAEREALRRAIEELQWARDVWAPRVDLRVENLSNQLAELETK